MIDRPTIIIQFLEDGLMDYHIVGNARLFIVDERCPKDRVYECKHQSPESVIQELITPGELVGHTYDDMEGKDPSPSGSLQ